MPCLCFVPEYGIEGGMSETGFLIPGWCQLENIVVRFFLQSLQLFRRFLALLIFVFSLSFLGAFLGAFMAMGWPPISQVPIVSLVIPLEKGSAFASKVFNGGGGDG
jgi:hypothetical protein